MSDSEQRFNEIADKLEELSKDEKYFILWLLLREYGEKMQKKFLKEVILLRIIERRNSIMICAVIAII